MTLRGPVATFALALAGLLLAGLLLARGHLGAAVLPVTALAAGLAGFCWQRSSVQRGQPAPDSRRYARLAAWQAVVAISLFYIAAPLVVLLAIYREGDDEILRALPDLLVLSIKGENIVFLLLGLACSFLLFWLAARLGLWIGARIASKKLQ